MKLNGEFGKSSEIKLNDEEIEPHEGDVFRFPFDVSVTADSPCPTPSRGPDRPALVRLSLVQTVILFLVI